MADSEFEEFLHYFDKLPQYIKAPPDCYTLVHDVGMDTNNFQDKKIRVPTNDIEVVIESLKLAEEEEDRYEKELKGCAGGESMWEPFSGDLQIVVPERNEEKVMYAPARRRRKLPEIPKQANRKYLSPNEVSSTQRQMSLAQELIEADISNNLCLHNGLNQTNSGINPYVLTIDTTETASYPSCRPFFVLKFPEGGGARDEESSPESEKYASLDSGHSTIHSEDGNCSKPYSPQIASIYEPMSPSTSSSSGVPLPHLEILEATHRGLHKFIPRHHDEIEVEIGDAIYVQKEADDLWCEGINLRTGMQGIFPSAYVVDVDYNDFDPNAKKVRKERYLLSYIGSIESLYHKGNDVLCQAVAKLSDHKGYLDSHTRPCVLEISDQGIHMLDKGKSSLSRVPCHDYFYALKNVSFCGVHPNDHRYFGFVTKHPTLNKFACHVFVSDDSARAVAEAVGRAFQRFNQTFIETAYPIEDIYLE